MSKKLKLHRTIAAISAAALTALGVGGVAVAQNATTTHQSPPAATAQPATTHAADAPDEANGTSAADTDNVRDENGKDDPAETAAGSEKPDAAGSKQSDGAETSSEVSGSDGPSGHADEPSNPNADHQAQGAE